MLALILLFLTCGIATATSGSSATDNLDFVGFHTVATMPQKLSDAVAITFQEDIFDDGNGPRIYLTGGCVTNQYCTVDATTTALTCYCEGITDQTVYFIPEKQQWTKVAPMNGARYRHFSAKVGNYLYVAGGRYLNDSLVSTIERYDPKSNQWTIVTTWANQGLASDGVAFGSGNTLYLAGGYDAAYNSPGYLYAYDTSSGQWTQLASMLKGRGDIEVAEYHAKFYVAGGWNMDNYFDTPYADVEYYDITSNTWTLVPSMHYARGDFVLTVMADALFAVGGETRPSSDPTNTHSIPVKYVERYTEANGTWVKEESIPDNLFRFVGAGYNSSTDVYSSAIYLFGGQGTFDNSTGHDYYPSQNYTIKYIPKSTVSSGGNNEVLSPGGIAGIVIAGVVVLGALVVACLVGGGYFVHKHYYSQLTDADEQQHHQAKPIGQPDVTIDLESLEMENAFPSAPTSSGLAAQQELVMMKDKDDTMVF